jgi:hypothetical protein
MTHKVPLLHFLSCAAVLRLLFPALSRGVCGCLDWAVQIGCCCVQQVRLLLLVDAVSSQQYRIVMRLQLLF